MKERKQPNKVYGKNHNCPNFIQCPICYGCRAYSSSNLMCKECEKDMKLNICSNKELHRTDLMSKLITKNKLNIEDKKIIFSSFNNEKEDD
ncbi:MAG: hypothetical protein SPI06_02230 [Terrisporobacter sp.]|uniref:hypothetical protein n=1 Tax=Terrisporobacter sp. TaxID=1965305 RepID=UPI002A9111BD|nr:hypothetical protein [Terrisporobacter sp.]MDY6152205.1 hypothetical protein [Terrisporobacter sp.]